MKGRGFIHKKALGLLSVLFFNKKAPRHINGPGACLIARYSDPVSVRLAENDRLQHLRSGAVYFIRYLTRSSFVLEIRKGAFHCRG